VASLSVPAAVVLGTALAGAFVGTGVYFGLRARPVVAPVPSASVAALPSSLAPVAALPVTAGSETAPLGPAANAALNDEVKRGFEAQRAHLLEKCWAPSFEKSPTPPATTIVFTLSFGPDGQPRSRSVREEFATTRPEVTACIQKELVVPPITPRGVRTRVEYNFNLP
jgi:hypothetical protein